MKTTVDKLIEMLIKIKNDGGGNKNVMVSDGSCIMMDFNSAYEDTITENDANDSGDCEGRVGEEVVTIS